MTIKRLRGHIAETGVRRKDIAACLGYSESMFSLFLNGRRTPPPDFEARVTAALDRLKRAEQAAEEARARVLAETVPAD